MATVGLSIAGNFFLPGAGTFIGAAIGGIIDQAIVFPLLFPQPSQQGPRINDKALQVASEGSSAAIVLGPRNSVAGTVIYLSDLIEEEETSGAKKGSGGVTIYKYFVNVAIAISTRPIKKVKRAFGDSKPIYDNGVRFRCDSFTVYDGTQTTPSPLLEALIGSAPSYKGTAYVVIERLALEDFGNRLPNVTFEVSQDEDLDVAGAIEHLLVNASLGATEYDTNRVTGCFLGYSLYGPQAVKDALVPLVQGYAVTVSEQGGKITFVSKGYEDAITVPNGDLMARRSGDDPGPTYYHREDINDYALPKSVPLTFISTDNDLQSGSITATRNELDSFNVVSMNLPLTLEPQQADAIAKRVLWSAEAERGLISLTLPPSYIHVCEGDALKLEDGTTVFVKEINRGANFVIEVKGTTFEPNVYTQVGSAPARTQAGITSASPAPLTTFVFDATATSDAIAESTGLYFASCATSGTYTVGLLYTSPLHDGTYTRRAPAPGEATMGYVVSGMAGAQPHLWDETTTIEVELLNGTIASVTEQECLDGFNRAFLINDNEVELIGFKTATALSEGRYRISGLLRGLNGSPVLTNASRFVFITQALGFLSDSSLLFSNVYVKGVTQGASLLDVSPQLVSCTGVSRTPLAPTNLRVRRGCDDRYSYNDVSSSGTTLSRAAGFPNINVGDYITLGGSSDAARNISWLVISKPNATTLEVYSAVSLGSESALSVAKGHVKDVRISWSRRGRKSSPIFAPGPTAIDEEGFQVLIMRGGLLTGPTRVIETDESSCVYTYDDQVVDGTSTLARLNIVVKQRSAVVTAGYPAVLEVAL